MNLHQHHVGIIGGGASGIFTLCSLLDLKIEEDNLLPLQITLIEKNNMLGEGMAYRGDYTSNLLNTAAGLFSGMNDDRDFPLKNQPSFLKWLRENHAIWRQHCPTLSPSDITKNAYLPRCLVGVYLRSITDFYSKIAHQYNTTIHFIQDEVEDIEADLDWQNAWPTQTHLAKILRCKTVGIMGTKLSALDTVGILTSHHYTGKIIMASRSGFLPSVKNMHHAYQPFLLTADTLMHLVKTSSGKLKLNDVINLVKAEMEYASHTAIDWDKLFSKKIFSLKWFQWQIKMAEDNSTLWNSVLASAREFFILSWHWLGRGGKIIFKKQYVFLWETYRFSMPLSTAYELMQLVKSERLSIVSFVVEPQIKQNRFQFSGVDCVNNKSALYEVDCLINATGINYDVNQIESTLIKNLLARGQLTANSFGGIMVDFNQLTVLNERRFFVTGDLTKGDRFFTNSYLVCSGQAAQVARSIIEDCVAELSESWKRDVPVNQIQNRECNERM